jgi:hypothetical protein
MPLTQVQGGMILPSTTLTTPIVATTMGVGGATPAASGSGITFPAAQSTSSDANTLDDYEEGTFTMTVTGSTTNPTVTYDDRTGFYTKIGNVVNVLMYLQTTARSGGSGDLRISGLPFSQSNTANRLGGNALFFAVNSGIGAAGLWPNGASGNNFVTILASNNNGSNWASVPVTNIPNSLSAIKIQFTYLVDY